MSTTPQQAQGPVQAPGEFFMVDGLRLHLHRSGPRLPGRPTIVIEAGAGGAALSYVRLQRALETEFDVCSYDRAGLGWSEPSAGPADAATLAERLHRLLAAAGVSGPLVMAGHSLGALILRVYAGRYPSQVAGLVLIDGSHPRQPMHPALPEMAALLEAHHANQLKALRHYRATGEPNDDLARSLQLFEDLPGVPQQLLASMSEHMLDTMLKECLAFAVSARQAEAAGSLGDLPLLVLWAPVLAAWPGFDQEECLAQWRVLQADAAALSTRGRLVAVDGAEHSSVVTDAALAAITAREIADMVRGIAA